MRKMLHSIFKKRKNVSPRILNVEKVIAQLVTKKNHYVGIIHLRQYVQYIQYV